MMLAQPKLAQMSDREIARRCGVSPTTVGAIRGEVSNLDTSDNPLETLDRDQEPDQRRGGDGRIYDVSRQGAAAQRTRQRMRIVSEADVEPPPTPEPESKPRPPKPPPSAEDIEIRELLARFERLSYPGQLQFERARRLAPRPVVAADIGAWLVTALDSQRREIADKAFDFIVTPMERLKHDETVRAWIEN